MSTPGSSTQLSESKELELVEKVELRLALSDTPEKFEKSLDIFLAPLLLKLASPYGSVRKAVLNSLKHVLSRLSSLQNVRLPVEKLVRQAQTFSAPEEDLSRNVQLYSLLLASNGVDRLPMKDQLQLIPVVMQGISTVPPNVSARLFHILCKLLLKTFTPKWQGSQDQLENFIDFKLEDDKDTEFLLKYFTKFFLLVPARVDPQRRTIPRGYSCPGLSAEDVSFLTYDAGVSFSREQLRDYRTAIFNFFSKWGSSNEFVMLRFLVVVAADSGPLSDAAISQLKRYSIPYEDNEYINYLIQYYTGNKTTGVPPVKHEFQEYILNILNRSVVATSDQRNVSLICSIGLHSDIWKLRSLCLQFVRNVAKYDPTNLVVTVDSLELGSVQTSIASLIRNNLQEEGWPKLQLGAATQQFNWAISQRRLSYETLGDILKRDFDLVKDLSYIEFLFDSLKGDLGEFRLSIQESLLSTLPHLDKLSPEIKLKLKSLISKFLSDDSELELSTRSDGDKTGKEAAEIKEKVMSLRYVSIKFANAAFDFSDPEARMYNVFGTSKSNRFDIIEEATKGLHPYWFRTIRASLLKGQVPLAERLATDPKETDFPTFESFVTLLLSGLATGKDSPMYNIMKSTINNAIRFAKQCLITQAVHGHSTVIVQDQDWSMSIEKAVSVDAKVSNLVSNFVHARSEEWFVNFVRLVCSEFIGKDETGKILSISEHRDASMGENALMLMRFSSDTVLKRLVSLIPSLLKFSESSQVNKDSDLVIAANILGIIGSTNGDNEHIKRILEVLDSASGVSETKLPVLLTASYIVPRLKLLNRSDKFTSTQLENLTGAILSAIKKHPNRTILFKYIDQLAKFGTLLSLPKEKEIEVVKEYSDFIQQKLMNNEIYTTTWGYLSLYATDQEQFQVFFEKLFATYKSKQVDFLFSVGEALSILAGGWRSQKLLDAIDVGDNHEIILESLTSRFYVPSRATFVLDKILEACDSTEPSLKRASCIWLLSLAQYLRHTPIIKQSVRDIHLKFLRFLPEKDEFIQDAASRGLSLIYDVGDQDMKEEMVKSLLKSFTGAANTPIHSGTVGKDTELFEPGVMNTGDGSISTYKDVLNLASEVGDPSLVYKFMSLAKDSYLWSSKKGIAFGLRAIMSRSSLEDMLVKDKKVASKLFPKLYRYRFDPYSSVARAMDDIWKSLVSDSTRVVNMYFDDILAELLSGMGNKEWRVREASTNALLQLVQVQPPGKFSSKMLEMWTMGFRTMDDIKESVRDAGTKFTTFLSKLLIRSIKTSDGVSPEKAKQTLDVVLPFLMGTKGINSDAEDVRKFSLNTLLDLVKNAGDAIKPFGPQLLFSFTLLFSSIEPQMMNYLVMNASKFNVDAGLIDTQRRNAVISSPLFEAIDKIVSISDDTDLEKYIEQAMKAVKQSVGLPSKVASSQVIILLTKRFKDALKPYSGKILKLCLNMLDSNNESVSASFATTFGYLFKVSSPEKCTKYSKKITRLYFEAETSTVNPKKIAGLAIQSILNQASDQFVEASQILLPLVFFASNGIDEKIGSLYENIWVEATSSASSTVKLYLEEIIDLISNQIKSNDYVIRKVCAKAILEVSKRVDANVSQAQIDRLFEITIDALAGRSWEGKEMVVDTLVVLVDTFKDKVAENEALRIKVGDALKTEVSRSKTSYVKLVISSYATYLSIFPEESNVTNVLIPKAQEIIEGLGFKDSTPQRSSTSEEAATVKKQKPSVDIMKKSSQKNIESEEYMIKLLKSISQILVSAGARLGSSYKITLDFVLDCLLRCFDYDSAFVYTWRTQLASCEIPSTLLRSFEGKRDLAENARPSFERYWTTSSEVNTRQEVIENVKIEYIKFGMLLSKVYPDLKPMVQSSFKILLTTDSNPRLQNIIGGGNGMLKSV